MQHTTDETPVVFSCGRSRLVGIHHRVGESPEKGVLLIVGGPQYRVGSHRQFVLLARALAKSGIPVFRFDYRGMGDSEGEHAGFDNVSEDIRSAIDKFTELQPGLERVVLWGLCDAASAAMIYAHGDSRVAGAILLNPWVRTDSGQARAIVKHYYLRRLSTTDFWRKLLSGRFGIRDSVIDLRRNIVNSIRNSGTGDPQGGNSPAKGMTFIERMHSGLSSFRGCCLVIVSGNDLTAAEFTDLVAGSAKWKRLLERRGFEVWNLPDADHTFSKAAWRKAVEDRSVDWLHDLGGDRSHS